MASGRVPNTLSILTAIEAAPPLPEPVLAQFGARQTCSGRRENRRSWHMLSSPRQLSGRFLCKNGKSTGCGGLAYAANVTFPAFARLCAGAKK